MERLGIYEVAPEDFGLIDYASSSKIEAQTIVRNGIDFLIKETFLRVKLQTLRHTGRKSNFHPTLDGVFAKLFVAKLPLSPIDMHEY